MNTINLFVDFKFTSLSPDAQPISLGIVSSDRITKEVMSDYLGGNNDIKLYKSFYAEFSDFDINRCDEWVKENVVGKLYCNNTNPHKQPYSDCDHVGNFSTIAASVKEWLSQFSDYQITFVVDCGTWDFYHLLQLLAIWDVQGIYPTGEIFKTGLPTLPINISPVPFELNQFISEKKGISVREAFELDREELALGIHSDSAFKQLLDEEYFAPYTSKINKHNALFDARVIKSIYEKLK